MATTCKKVSYGTEAFALADIRTIQKDSDRATVPIRAYHCNICNGWHLTSKPRHLDVLVKEQADEIQKLKSENGNLTKKANDVFLEKHVLQKKYDSLKEKNEHKAKLIAEKATEIGELKKRVFELELELKYCPKK